MPAALTIWPNKTLFVCYKTRADTAMSAKAGKAEELKNARKRRTARKAN